LSSIYNEISKNFNDKYLTIKINGFYLEYKTEQGDTLKVPYKKRFDRSEDRDYINIIVINNDSSIKNNFYGKKIINFLNDKYNERKKQYDDKEKNDKITNLKNKYK
jgi:hypothetical protein